MIVTDTRGTENHYGGFDMLFHKLVNLLSGRVGHPLCE